ncbi:MAG: TetR family transcriptional regulator C-terminal domain-containing protein [Sporichthyaceae bacterium]|nr:TetR family transcriptional regulator C-terminal domain-containing protein [Sporichthyaceae bacterium]
MTSGTGRPTGRTTRAEQLVARRAALLDAAERVALERGLANTRVADVAAATAVSAGLIHYHFSSKDELFVEMLRTVAQRDIDRVRRIVDTNGTAVARLDRVLREFIPAQRGDQSWVLWIDAWGAALRDPGLRDIITELDDAWAGLLEQVIRDGAETGEFSCADPAAAAFRLAALLDGVGVRIALQGKQSRREALRHARIAAAREVGLTEADFPT